MWFQQKILVEPVRKKRKLQKKRKPKSKPTPFDSVEEGRLFSEMGVLLEQTPSDVIHSVHVARQHDRWDYSYIHNTQLILFDFDGDYYHTAARAQYDYQKTINAVQTIPNVRVVRIRTTTNPLQFGERYPDRMQIVTYDHTNITTSWILCTTCTPSVGGTWYIDVIPNTLGTPIV